MVGLFYWVYLLYQFIEPYRTQTLSLIACFQSMSQYRERNASVQKYEIISLIIDADCYAQFHSMS